MDIVVAGVLCYPGVTSMVAPDDDLLRLMLCVARDRGEERERKEMVAGGEKRKGGGC